LEDLNIGYLATIGGDDTMFAASQVAKAAGGRIRVCHVRKTIDNDLPLPGEIPTFGFETARQIGSDLVKNLMEDSRTTGRWYFVVVMGRSAGHLARVSAKPPAPHSADSGGVWTDSPSPRYAIFDAIIKRRAYGIAPTACGDREELLEICRPTGEQP
jgi:hypothetical protein